MSDLARTLIICGLISGTQPFTIMGLLLVLGAPRGNRNAWWYLFGGFSAQTLIVLVLGVLVGGAVDETSSPGRSLVILRIVAGVALLLLGVWLRRAPSRPAPATPKVFDRLKDLQPRGAILAGVAIADYQGPMLATAALATASVSRSAQVLGWALYCLPATGIPVATVIVVNRSVRAKGELERFIAWIMHNRRGLASWVCLIGGLALVADGLTTYLTAT